MKSKWLLFLSISPLIIFLGIFFYWPLFEIISIAVLSDPEVWSSVIDNPLFSRFFYFTFLQSFYSVLGSVLLGLPTGYLLSRTKIFQPKLMKAMVTVPFLFPPLVILIGFVVLFEPAGFFGSNFTNWEFSPFTFWGIVLAHVFYNTALIARIMEGAFSTEPLQYHELADTLGASLWMKFRTITLPHIRPALESALLLVFLYSFNSFAIVLILGEVRLQTLEVMIYNQSRLRFNIENAAILAVIQLLINLLVIFIYAKRKNYQTTVEDVDSLKEVDYGIVPSILVFSVILLTWSPVLMVFRLTIIGLFNAPDIVIDQLLSSEYDRFLGTSSSRVLLNTLVFGISVALLAVIIGVLTIFASYLQEGDFVEKLSIPFTLLPMGTSAITVSFAILQTHGNFDFFSETVFIYIISAQLIAALPFASRALFSAWQRVPKDLILVAETLGSNKITAFKNVVIPYIGSALFISFLFSFAISIGEFGATFYLVRNEWTTLSLAIEKLFASRNTLLPNLYASILVIFALLLFWIIEKLGSVELKL